MKKNILSVLMVMIMVTLSVIPTFAEETTISKKEEHKIENEIAGKITSINANYVNIDVAIPKKLEKPNKTNAANTTAKEEKKNIDDMFTLTGEKKTINIAQAKFVGDVRIMNGNNKNDTNKTNGTNNQEKSKELTYTDFAVGDYVRIVLADDGSNVAKVVKKGGLFRAGRPDGIPNGKPDIK